ncbi:hypothetical protein [Bernardetia sp.]|uniref:hypothetical protein n=1 Tax=Bernardetia sp. TaxID=1937974 RepID=UPI0025C40E7B|nr:hypothetical protein [Bernardetia sp.]
MNIHQLDKQNHSHVIGRKDAVTGDKITGQDEVVFCSVCQSVFLKDSWEYMNSQHCEQSETLDFIPQPTPSFFAKKREKFSFTLSEQASSEKIQIIISTLLATFLIVGFSKIFSDSYFLIQLFLAVGISLGVGLIVKTNYFKDILENKYSKIKILENGIELRGEKFYPFYEMKAIEYVNSFKITQKQKGSLIQEDVVPSDNSLYIFLKNEQIVHHRLPKYSEDEIKNFLFALAYATQFVTLNFYTEDKKELHIAQQIKQKYKTRVSLLTKQTETSIWN